MNDVVKQYFQIILLFLIINCNLYAIAEYSDSNKVIIKKGSGKLSGDYNISDIIVKKSHKFVDLYILRVTVDLPVLSMLVMRIIDSTNQVVLELIRDKKISPGIYILQWEMSKYPEGRYWCEFETEHFIYRKDFHIG